MRGASPVSPTPDCITGNFRKSIGGFYLVVLGILPTDARYEVQGSTLSEVVLWTCSDRELHLKGSLAMLIRGLQNPFVTRSMSFQHENVERSFYLVFVLSAPCCFYLSFVLPSGFSSS